MSDDFLKQWQQAVDATAGNEGANEEEETTQSAPADANAEGDDPSEGTQPEPEKVPVGERAKFREQKRAFRTQLQAEQERLAAQQRDLDAKYAKFVAAEKRFLDGDPEGAVREAFGVEYEELTKDIIKKAHGRDPRVDRLLKEQQEKNRQLEQERARIQEQQNAQEFQRRQAAYTQENIIKPLQANEETRGLVDIGGFTEAIFHEQYKVYQESGGEEELSLEEATDKVKARYLEVYKKLSKVFGSHHAESDEDATGATDQHSRTAERTGQPGTGAVKKGGKARHIPPTRATSASKKGNPDPVKDPEGWMKWMVEGVNSAAAGGAAR